MAVRKNTELPLHMVISVNQLSLCGAEADMIEELPFVPRAPVKPAASGQLENMEFLHNLLSQKCKPIRATGKPAARISNDLRKYQKSTSYPDLGPKKV